MAEVSLIEQALRARDKGDGWKVTYPLIQAAALAFLETLPLAEDIGITDLIKRLAPDLKTKDRDHVYNALKAGTKHDLKLWSGTRTQPDRYRPGRTVQTVIFHRYMPPTIDDHAEALQAEVDVAVSNYEAACDMRRQYGPDTPFHELEQEFLGRAIERLKNIEKQKERKS